MPDPSLDILVLGDLHYIGAAEAGPPAAGRVAHLGPLLLRKALLRLRHQGIAPGLIVLLGDLVDDSAARGAARDMEAIAEEARQARLPVLLAPGNHDGDPALAARLFNCPAGLHEIGGYGFLVFHDRYAEGDHAVRSHGDLALPARMAAERPGLPLVALQHNPLRPPIASKYPYLPDNADAIRAGYREAGVVLSLSGHYHAGLAPRAEAGTVYYTVPAACEPPFRLAVVSLRGRAVSVREESLRVEHDWLVDCHCHTEYSYCSTTVRAADNLRVAGALGLRRSCFTDHTFQLYFANEEAWSWKWQHDEAMVRRSWVGGRGRMPAYRAFARRMRGPNIAVGVEVDLLSNGRLLLADEDRDGWDLLIGAIHAIAGFQKGKTPRADAERLFLRDTERLLAHPIQVLAHPFRFFSWAGLPKPAHLYATVAAWLARAGVAAEINYHINQPELPFIRECLARGVKLALGTDAHDLAEVGELWPHLRALREAGVVDTDLSRVLYSPFAL